MGNDDMGNALRALGGCNSVIRIVERNFAILGTDVGDRFHDVDLSVEVRTSTAMHPCKVHHADSSFLGVEGLAVGTCMPTGGLLRGGIDLAVKAIVVRAPTKDLIA